MRSAQEARARRGFAYDEAEVGLGLQDTHAYATQPHKGIVGSFQSRYSTCASCCGNSTAHKVREDEECFVITHIQTICCCASTRTKYFVQKDTLSYVRITTKQSFVRLVLALIVALGFMIWLIVEAAEGGNAPPSTQDDTNPNNNDNNSVREQFQIAGIFFGVACFWVLVEVIVIIVNHKCGVREVVFFAGEKITANMTQEKATELSCLLKRRGICMSTGRRVRAAGSAVAMKQVVSNSALNVQDASAPPAEISFLDEGGSATSDDPVTVPLLA